MSFWERIASLFKGGGSSGNRLLDIYVLSRRCNEPIAGQVDLFNELSRTEEDGGDTFYTRKVLHTSGDTRCFDQVEVHLWFNRNKQLAHYDVEGGRWLEREEFDAELARFHAAQDNSAEQDQSGG